MNTPARLEERVSHELMWWHHMALASYMTPFLHEMEHRDPNIVKEEPGCTHLRQWHRDPRRPTRSGLLICCVKGCPGECGKKGLDRGSIIIDGATIWLNRVGGVDVTGKVVRLWMQENNYVLSNCVMVPVPHTTEQETEEALIWIRDQAKDL